MLHERRRIMVIGSGGAGKSTFARELAKRTGLPLIHLDRHYWRLGWSPTPDDEWAECVRQLSSGDAWIIDGNYSRTLSIRIQRCDAIVFFDMPRLVCLVGILQRWLVHQFKERTDLPAGCRERVNVDFIRWVWDYPRRSRPRIEAALREARPSVEILTITRRGETRGILDAVSKPAARQAVAADGEVGRSAPSPRRS